MLKKVLWGILFIALLVSVVYGIFYLKKIKTPVSNALDAIPTDVALIIESRKSQHTWKKISNTNIMWEDLISTETFRTLNEQGSFLDSLFSRFPGAEDLLDGHSLFITAHPMGANFAFMFLYSLPDVTKQSMVNDFIKHVAGTRQVQEKDFENAKINLIEVDATKKFAYTITHGIFISSFNTLLVEQAIKHLNSGKSLRMLSDFKSIYKVKGKNANANIYLNYTNFSKLLGNFLNEKNDFLIPRIDAFANWTEVDVSLRPNILMLNGFSHASDSGSSKFVQLFKDQEPQRIEVTKVLPKGTSTFLYMGVSNFNSFYKEFKLHLKNKGDYKKYDAYVTEVNNEFSVDLESELLSWIENEITYAVTDASEQEYMGNCYALLRSNNIIEAQKSVNRLAATIAKYKSLAIGLTSHRDHIIALLDLPDVLSKTLGSSFEKIHTNYFTAIDNYIVFANSPDALKQIIDAYENGNVLANDKQYRAFSEEIFSEANIYLYSNIYQSVNIYKDKLSEKQITDMDKHAELFKKFEALAYQLSNSKKMFYTNVFLKHNPIHKEESGSLWEISLDHPLSTMPTLVTNHASGALEVFVQDDSNKIYLISNTGKILWRKQLNEKIIGEVQQIDLLKNNKLQLLFNTASKMYLLDRNGKDVGNYPVRFKSEATNALTVFDYENKKDYRILIACEDKKVYNYKGDGSIVKGWDFKPAQDIIQTPIKRCVINAKDYILMIDAKGRTYCVNRKGESRLKFRQRLNSGIQDFYINEGKDLSRTKIVALDTLGNIYKLSLSDKLENIKIKTFESIPGFTYQDLNFDKSNEYIFLDEKLLSVYDKDKSLLFAYSLNGKNNTNPNAYKIGEKYYVGLTNKENSEVLLIDTQGNLKDGFPVTGHTSFSIGDLNNAKSMVLIVGGNGNKIYAYPLNGN